MHSHTASFMVVLKKRKLSRLKPKTPPKIQTIRNYFTIIGNKKLLKIKYLWKFLTCRSLSKTFHHHNKFRKGDNSVFILVKKHENFFEFCHLFRTQLPFLLQKKIFILFLNFLTHSTYTQKVKIYLWVLT